MRVYGRVCVCVYADLICYCLSSWAKLEILLEQLPLLMDSGTKSICHSSKWNKPLYKSSLVAYYNLRQQL